MTQIDKKKPVLVTGGSGYLASWIVKQLLDQDIDVHATVRNVNDKSKVGHLLEIAENCKASLTLFEADLLQPGSFDAAMQECELVIHTASPFIIDNITDPENQLVRPAKEGTRNVLESVNRHKSVKRVVLTSSVASVYGDCADAKRVSGGAFDESHWNTSSSLEHQPYYYSKAEAEKLAWEMCKKQDRWDLSAINPGLILGPSLSHRKDSTSAAVLLEIASGEFQLGAPEIWNGIVDVRTVAQAHIVAGYGDASGKRFITVADTLTHLDIAKIIRSKWGDSYPLPRWNMPKFLLWLLAPVLELTRAWVKRNIGIPIDFNVTASKQCLSLKYIPVEKTINDHFEQLVNNGWIGKGS